MAYIVRFEPLRDQMRSCHKFRNAHVLRMVINYIWFQLHESQPQKKDINSTCWDNHLFLDLVCLIVWKWTLLTLKFHLHYLENLSKNHALLIREGHGSLIKCENTSPMIPNLQHGFIRYATRTFASSSWLLLLIIIFMQIQALLFCGGTSRYSMYIASHIWYTNPISPRKVVIFLILITPAC